MPSSQTKATRPSPRRCDTFRLRRAPTTKGGTMSSRGKFDLAAEVKASPPKVWKKPSPFDHPRVQEWLNQLLVMRDNVPGISNRYIAEKLTKGARTAGTIPPTAFITESAVQSH